MTDDPPRSLFRLVWADLAAADLAAADLAAAGIVDGGVEFRPVRNTDTTALGRLMERAYAGTIDDDLGDNTDGVLEVQDWFESGGRPESSSIALAGERLLAACLISRSSVGKWWVGYIFTYPDVKARGLGKAVTAKALEMVRATGAEHVWAGVTDGNTPSERLLRSVGFVRVGSA